VQQAVKRPGLFARIAAQIQAAAEAQAAAARAAAQPRPRAAPAPQPGAPPAEASRPRESDAAPAAPPSALLATFRAPQPFLSAFVLAEALGPPVALRSPEASRWGAGAG